ncbi:MAG: tol-pal system-associated acyl-CoA thioesterase [Gammaproteobacteria bacterium]|nr:tol-pal system-associated acyl-CoA thioesterase [Gammaproteobacteria bacterium]
MKEFNWPVRVYYEDTDAGGVVYYANYLKFMERARSEWLRDLGFEQDQLMKQQSLLFAVRSVQVDYLRPARLNDALTVTVSVADYGRVSIRLNQTIHKAADPQLLCSGQIKIVSLGAGTFKPTAIPTELMQKLQDGSSRDSKH